MERPDTFKQLYLGLLVFLLGLKYLFVVIALLVERLPATEFDVISEIRVLVPVVALFLGARAITRHGLLRPRRSSTRGAVVLALFGLGCVLATADLVGLAALMSPAQALAAVSPVGVLLSGMLWTLWVVAVWLFGGRIVGVLFWRRPGMDEQESPDESEQYKD